MTLGTFACHPLDARARTAWWRTYEDLAGLSRRRPGPADGVLHGGADVLAGGHPAARAGSWPKYYWSSWPPSRRALVHARGQRRIVARVIGAFYYLAIVKMMYFDDKSDTEFPKGGGAIVEDAVITASALWLSVIGYLFIPGAGGPFGQRRRGAVLDPADRADRDRQVRPTPTCWRGWQAASMSVRATGWSPTARPPDAAVWARAWGDGLGNFMGSTVVQLHAMRPRCRDAGAGSAASRSRATVTALAPTVDFRLKWPNDVPGRRCQMLGHPARTHRQRGGHRDGGQPGVGARTTRSCDRLFRRQGRACRP